MPTSRIANKAALIAGALAIQGVVLTAGWLVTFRVVQRSFAQVIQDRTIEQTKVYADRIASLIPENTTAKLAYGSPEWQALQDFIAHDAFQELPDGSFACVIEPDGRILCHPELEESPSIRNRSFAGKSLLAGLEPTAASRLLLDAGGGDGAGGVVEFASGDFHYVATKPLAGSGLRLLIHQPVGALVRVGAESTRFVMVAAGLAGLVVLLVTGVGLVALLRRYENVHVELNRQMSENLELARRIQENSLPQEIPELPGYDIGAVCTPAQETGGDTYDVVRLADTENDACLIDGTAETGRVAFLLADATGHGIGPALAVTQLNAMARLAWQMGGSLLDVARLVNEQLSARLPDGRFVTAVFGVLDSRTHEFELFSAGQGPLMIWRAARGAMEPVETQSYPLGVMPELGSSETARIRLEPGDAFVAISDGVFEAMNDAGEQFGEGRVAAYFPNLAAEPVPKVLDRIGNGVTGFTGGRPADDDRTMLVVKRTKD